MAPPAEVVPDWDGVADAEVVVDGEVSIAAVVLVAAAVVNGALATGVELVVATLEASVGLLAADVFLVASVSGEPTDRRASTGADVLALVVEAFGAVAPRATAAAANQPLDADMPTALAYTASRRPPENRRSRVQGVVTEIRVPVQAEDPSGTR